MARPLRIEFAGAIYHVMSRGNARQDIVLDDVDREKRLDWLRRTVETYGWRLHALMTQGGEGVVPLLPRPGWRRPASGCQAELSDPLAVGFPGAAFPANWARSTFPPRDHI